MAYWIHVTSNLKLESIIKKNSLMLILGPANAQKAAIKFNLKSQPPQQQQHVPQQVGNVASPTGPRKSRFNNLNNVAAQQKEFEQRNQAKIETQAPPPPASPANNAASSASTPAPASASAAATPDVKQQSDIVFDIHKWPNSLKTFCAKVYQHYQNILLVTEDQVTKYLQQRITDAFKIKPNLEIGWETEQMPDVEQIKRVAPLSAAQQLQLKQQQQASANQKKLNAAKAAAHVLQFKKAQQQPNAFNYHALNAANKLKSRQCLLFCLF